MNTSNSEIRKKLKTIVDKILQKVLTTTEDTYEVLVGQLYNIPTEDRNSVLKELEKPFSELEEKYIAPIILPKTYDKLDKARILNDDGFTEMFEALEYCSKVSAPFRDEILYVIKELCGLYVQEALTIFQDFSPHYDKNSDIDTKGQTDEVISTANWVLRKEIEIDTILMLRGIDRIQYHEKYPFGTIAVRLTPNQTLKLYKFLEKKQYIGSETTFETFYKALSGRLYKKPQSISWKGNTQLFHIFIHYLHIYGFIDKAKDEISGKIGKYLLFIDSNKQKSFNDIRSRAIEFEKKIALLEKTNKKYREKHDKDIKLYNEIKELHSFIKKLRDIQ